MDVLRRKEVIIDEREAAKAIKDGMSIAIGGFINSLHPMALIRQIIRNGVRELTVVGSGSAGLEVDLLIGTGHVKKLISPYVGAESLAPIGPFFRAVAQRGELDMWECDEGLFYAGLRAAAGQLPFEPWRVAIGTSYPELNPDIKIFQDPLKGETLLAVPPINIDVALIHAGFADAYGNVQHVGSSFSDLALVRAADKTIVEVDKVLSNEEIRKHPEKTTIHGADAIVRAPYGSHPYASPGFYLEDKEHIKEYVNAANAYLKTGDKGPFKAYLKKYVFGPETHADYLEVIGIRRLISLHEF